MICLFEETLCSFQVSILPAGAGAETEAVSFLFPPFLFGFLKITGLYMQAVFQNWVPRPRFRAGTPAPIVPGPLGEGTAGGRWGAGEDTKPLPERLRQQHWEVRLGGGGWGLIWLQPPHDPTLADPGALPSPAGPRVC